MPATTPNTVDPPEPAGTKVRTFTVRLHTNPADEAEVRDVRAISFTTPTGQRVLIEPSEDGCALIVRNPDGPLDHSLRPANPATR